MIEKHDSKMFRIPCVCTHETCPCHGKCCFLPTLCYSVDGKIDILFVGQGGGVEERKQVLPFVGEAGERLRYLILLAVKETGKSIGVAFSNTIRDNPEKNRIPTDEEVGYCKQFLMNDIQYLQKNYNLKCVVPLGNHACSVMINSTRGISSLRGTIIEKDGLLYAPTFHPSYCIRQTKSIKKELGERDMFVKNDIIQIINKI